MMCLLAIVLIFLPGPAQDESVTILSKIQKGDTFAVTTTFKAPRTHEPFKDVSITADVEVKIEEVTAEALVAKAKITRFEGSGELLGRTKGKFTIKYGDGKFTALEVDVSGELTSDEEKAAIEHIFAKPWRVTQGLVDATLTPAEGDTNRRLKESVVFRPLYPLLFAAPGRLPFDGKKVEWGAPFEVAGATYTVHRVDNTDKKRAYIRARARNGAQLNILFDLDGFIEAWGAHRGGEPGTESGVSFSANVTRVPREE